MPFVFNPDNSRANDDDEGNDNLAPSLQNILNSNKQLKGAVQARDLDYKRYMNQLDLAEQNIKERFHSLEAKKASIIEAHGDGNACGADLLEINAGGKIIVAKRSTLTQLKGSRLEGEGKFVPYICDLYMYVFICLVTNLVLQHYFLAIGIRNFKEMLTGEYF